MREVMEGGGWEGKRKAKKLGMRARVNCGVGGISAGERNGMLKGLKKFELARGWVTEIRVLFSLFWYFLGGIFSLLSPLRYA